MQPVQSNYYLTPEITHCPFRAVPPEVHRNIEYAVEYDLHGVLFCAGGIGDQPAEWYETLKIWRQLKPNK